MSAGSVHKRKDGRWCAALQVNGVRRFVYGKTEREARQKLAQLHREMGAGVSLPGAGRRTINNLLDLWLETAELSPVTRDRYEWLLNKHVRPKFGTTRLAVLTPALLQEFYNQVKKQSGAATAKLVHQRLHHAFRLGVMWGYLAENPADRVIPPAYRPKRKELWTKEQLAAFLETNKENAYTPLWIVALTTGLRLAELSGLQWSDVDLEGGTLHVKRALHKIKVLSIVGDIVGADPDASRALTRHFAEYRRAAVSAIRDAFEAGTITEGPSDVEMEAAIAQIQDRERHLEGGKAVG